MSPRRTFLFVSRWRGVIGPNVGLRQLVREAVARGHRTHVATPWPDDEYAPLLAQEGAALHALPQFAWAPRSLGLRKWWSHLASRRALWRAVEDLTRRLDPDLICFNGENFLGLPRLVCPVVVLVRGIRFAELGWRARAFFLLQKRHVTGGYLVASQAVARALQAVGVPQSLISTVSHGVDVDRFRPCGEAPRLPADLNVPQTARVIGTVGHMEPRKGFHHLVDALPAILQAEPGVHCLLVGGPPGPEHESYARSLKDAAGRLGVMGRLRFCGYRQDVPELLACMEVVVHPSETESFGRAIAEAMACGKPVVGFDVGAVGELIDDGRTGILVPPFDPDGLARAVVRLLRDDSLRAGMGSAAREKALRCYDLRKNIGAAMDILESKAEVQAGGRTR